MWSDEEGEEADRGVELGGDCAGGRSDRQTERRPVGGGGDGGFRRRGVGAVGRKTPGAKEKARAVETGEGGAGGSEEISAGLGDG